jgi:hypothetical protein
VTQTAELRTLERKGSGLVGDEFHDDRLAPRQLPIDVEGVDLDSVIAVLISATDAVL